MPIGQRGHGVGVSPSRTTTAPVRAADPMVEYAHPDYREQIAYVPNDPYVFSANRWHNPSGPDLDDLWTLKLIDAPAAWDE